MAVSSMLPRLGLVAVALVLGGCASAASPRPSATGTPVAPTVPAATAEQTAGEPVACARADVAATGGGWSGGAGSRGAEVTVTNGADAPCLLPASPTIALFDAGGATVLQGPPNTGGDPLTLAPGATATFSFRISNWCDEGVSLPLHVSVLLVAEAAAIDGVPITALSDLPPCNGPTEPPAVDATGWEMSAGS